MEQKEPTIFYTKTDEAPLLATYSFLPIIRGFLKKSGVNVELADISLAGRILAVFPEALTAEQRCEDTLSALGKLALEPHANIIKLPNISASVPQLKAAIAELQGKGFKIPSFVDDPTTDEEKAAKAKYNKIKGSAVNPVLREGNSDRRAPPAVKAFARENPHSMGKWSKDSKSHVATMTSGDFFSNEQSVTMDKATELTIQLVQDGKATALKKVAVLAGEVVDSTFMSKKVLVTFLDEQIADAKAKDVLFSLHLKATMMKVSDPIIFGHAVRCFFKNVFSKHAATLERLGVDVRNGFGDLLSKIKTLPDDEQKAIEADIQQAYADGPALAMVDSDRGITNLHVPSDVIIDASMPAAIRDSGCMWDAEGKRKDMKATIPDHSYAGVYQATIDFCRENGAFDVTTMGSCPNVGLMAKKAEEYGSHDKTFEMTGAGTMQVVDAAGAVVMEHQVEEGDIWRMCQAKDGPIRNWVELAVTRARATGVPAVFWLDEKRPHDAQLIVKVNTYLKDHDTAGLEMPILPPAEACEFTLARLAKGQDAISVTGNVLRDYNTDLFPILEVGTSAKMLSIVPLMKGGGLFETGAGGSAPKHVQQFTKENHLRWDSLGEFLALAVSLDKVATTFKNQRAGILGKTLDIATTKVLLNNKGPSRKVKELDNRGSHFYLALYWARELAAQGEDNELKEHFAALEAKLAGAEEAVVKELLECQGPAMDVGGYYLLDDNLASKAMRPSATFNAIVDGM